MTYKYEVISLIERANVNLKKSTTLTTNR